MQFDISLNEQVIMYLTPEGVHALSVYRDNAVAQLRKYPFLGQEMLDLAVKKYSPAPDNTYMGLMWEIMAIFGPFCANGAELFQGSKLILARPAKRR